MREVKFKFWAYIQMFVNYLPHNSHEIFLLYDRPGLNFFPTTYQTPQKFAPNWERAVKGADTL